MDTALKERFRALCARIEHGNAGLEQINELNRILSATGESISPTVEEAALRIALTHHPDDRPMLQRLCTVKQSLAKMQLADSVELARNVLAGDPNDYWANYNVAVAYLYNWRPIDAWSYALRCTEIDPSQKYGYELLFNIACRIAEPFNVTPRLIRIVDSAQKSYPHLDLYREPDFSKRQQAAICRGIPPMLVNTLPKSGTVYIRGRLSEALDVPFRQLTLAPLYNTPIPSWLEDFGKGGAVAAEHFMATPETVDLLHNARLRRLVIHVRDPRQSALSLLHFQSSQSQYSGPIGTVEGDMFRACADIDGKFRQVCELYLPWTMRWLRSWMSYAHSADRRLDIKFTDYEKNFLQSEDAFFSEMLEFFGIQPSLFDRGRPVSQKHKGHFRKGNPMEWREISSAATQRHISSLMDKNVHEYFGWDE